MTGDIVSSGRVFRTALQLLAAITFLGCRSGVTGDLRIAVASNFSGPITKITELFEKETGRRVTLSFGSTGKHYAQIRNGAPFDLFFAADARRPALLEREGVALAGSRFTYAIGRLALWSPDSNRVDSLGQVLTLDKFRFLAMANPDLAPYGKAAREVLEAKGVWDELQGRIVQGENIGQSFQFVRSGNAELGFVAYSQVMGNGGRTEGSIWLVPDSLYKPIEQQAVILRDAPGARAFVAFVRGDEGQKIIHDFGYETP